MTEHPTGLSNMRLAVLIDADNVPRDCLRSAMEELAIYGTPTIKRIYGDWTSPNIAGWKTSILENAVTPIQQYGYTTGKNSTDSAMIIDAMDILYGAKTDGFVLMSSDSDFTRLAIRLREAGMYVIGIGERKTPSPFIIACDKFIYIEVIRERANKSAKQAEEDAKLQRTNGKTQKKKSETVSKRAPDKAAEQNGDKPDEKTPEKAAEKTPDRLNKVPDSIVELIADSIADLADEEGYTNLSNLGNLLIKKQPDFDSRNFGFGKLSNMLKSLDRFELDVRNVGDNHIRPIFVRDKEA